MEGHFEVEEGVREGEGRIFEWVCLEDASVLLVDDLAIGIAIDYEV